jgi:hypothetical protein
VRAYDVHVEKGAALLAETPPPGMRVKGPYVAQTYRVTTEGDYVVVELQRMGRTDHVSYT